VAVVTAAARPAASSFSVSWDFPAIWHLHVTLGASSVVEASWLVRAAAAAAGRGVAIFDSGPAGAIKGQRAAEDPHRVVFLCGTGSNLWSWQRAHATVSPSTAREVVIDLLIDLVHLKLFVVLLLETLGPIARNPWPSNGPRVPSPSFAGN